MPAMHRVLRVATWILGILIALVAAGIGGVVYVLLPRLEFIGESLPVFDFRPELVITQTAPGGIVYTLNNSTATFRLDVARPDEHSRRLFRDYRAAWQYCRQHNLPTIPSVQVVQGKCKQFDDRLCMALETAMQAGVPGDERLGKRAALEALLRRLVAFHAAAPAAHRPVVRRALVHVGAALTLGGARPALDADLAREMDAAVTAFLADPDAQPSGFWTQSEALRGIFLQDRFLARGFALSSDWPVCVILAQAVMDDLRLAEAFGRFRAVDARLTNPSSFVKTSTPLAPPARCLSCAELAALLPAATGPVALLDAPGLAAAEQAARRNFGDGAGLALVSYAQSKEYDLLQRLLANGVATGDTAFIPLVIAAVKSGRLRLDPQPNSGWYDYQWHALETLLVPERAPEAAKLLLTPAYRARLENAFKTGLTKIRETHVKHMPGIIGSLEETRPEVRIGPAFCVEPVATVYLRCARGYRFLQNTLHATLGADALRQIRLGAGAADADAELYRMAMLCYGFYEQLGLQIGRPLDYLDGEMTPDDRAAARTAAESWLAGLDNDADLAADTRVAVPIVTWPNGPVRYWATGGVRLERVEYTYRDHPKVAGPVEAVFVPTLLYLPTDVFLEFERPAAQSLTRETFRALCDRSPGERALRAALGGASPKVFPWTPALAVVLSIAVVMSAWRCHRRLLTLWVARPRWLLLKTTAGLIVALMLMALVLALSPRLRTRFLVKCIASKNAGAAMIIESRIAQFASPAMADELADLLSDPDAQTRCLAAEYLAVITWNYSGENVQLSRIPGMKTRLLAAADDPVPEVAADALLLLCDFSDEQTLDFLLAKLKAVRDVDLLCYSTIYALRGASLEGGPAPRAIEAILPFLSDQRSMVRKVAWSVLSRIPDETMARRLAEHFRLANARGWKIPLYGFENALRKHAALGRIYNPVLREAAGMVALDPDYRMDYARTINDPQLAAEAYLAIYRQPSANGRVTTEQCRQEVAETLARRYEKQGLTVLRVAELADDTNLSLAEAAAALLRAGPP